jgi:hypothetical protein
MRNRGTLGTSDEPTAQQENACTLAHEILEWLKESWCEGTV